MKERAMTSTNKNLLDKNKFKSLFNHLKNEPLIHFLLVALLIFVVDKFVSLSRNDMRNIVIPDAVVSDAKLIYKKGFNTEPSEKDLKILLSRWIDNEVLYREGLALGLDKGDSSIRERVIFKALSLTQSTIKPPALEESGLKNWFEKNRDQYDEPTLIDFHEAIVSSTSDEKALAKFVSALNGNGHLDETSSLNIFKNRSVANIVDGYGSEFADALQKSKKDEWTLLKSKSGLRVVLLKSIVAGEKADFENVKAKVYTDWKNQTVAEQTKQAVLEMRNKYKITAESEKQ